MSDEIKAYALAGWQAQPLDEELGFVHLILIPDEEALKTGQRVSVPLTLTPAQAREFAGMLEKLAEGVEKGVAEASPETPPN